MTVPTDNLIRAHYGAGSMEMRADTDDGDGRTLHGHFAVFNRWTEINSWVEGRFLERIAPGAFRDVFKDRRNIRVLYEHGADPQIGTKPIAEPKTLEEDDIGARYEADLFDVEYANQLLPALRTKQLGASFRFSVAKETWVEPKRSTDHNPGKLPERTIEAVDPLYEFGPVTWGAYSDATAGVRSGTDSFVDRLLSDPLFVARFTERAGLAVVERVLENLPEHGDDSTPAEPPTEPAPSERPTASTYRQATPPRLTTDQRRAFRDRVETVMAGLT